jgi:hypothetical protein
VYDARFADRDSDPGRIRDIRSLGLTPVIIAPTVHATGLGPDASVIIGHGDLDGVRDSGCWVNCSTSTVSAQDAPSRHNCAQIIERR